MGVLTLVRVSLIVVKYMGKAWEKIGVFAIRLRQTHGGLSLFQESCVRSQLVYSVDEPCIGEVF